MPGVCCLALPCLALSYPHITCIRACGQVTAGKATVLERARRRGATTKRVVPDEVLLASLEQVRVDGWMGGWGTDMPLLLFCSVDGRPLNDSRINQPNDSIQRRPRGPWRSWPLWSTTA